MNRVVEVQLSSNAKQSDLYAAIEPVFDRITKRYGAAQARLADARAKKEEAGQKSARDGRSNKLPSALDASL